MKIIVPGPPIAQKRPKFFRKGNGVGTYNPQEAEAGQWLLTARPQITEKIMGPVILLVTAYFQRPKGHYGTGRNSDRLKQSAPAYHVVKPDGDNVLKFVKDCLRHAAFEDDSKVVQCAIVKAWADDGGGPRTVVDIYPAGEWYQLPRAYAYRVYLPDTDTIYYGVTTDIKEAMKKDAFPIEMIPFRELKRDQ